MGSQLIQEKFEKLTEFNKEELMAEAKIGVMEQLKRSIRPEFLNRIDEVIMFTPLSREDVRNIVDLQMSILLKQLGEQGIQIELSGEALDWLAQLGYDPTYGARPLKRVIQKRILNELSKAILSNSINRDSKVKIELDDKNQFVFLNS
jgi:ATP-dependent Clp protease ATP-binding subunit ClpB